MPNRYKVIINFKAKRQLEDIVRYMKNEYYSSWSIESFLKSIEKTNEQLMKSPKLYALVIDEPWHSMGVRRILIRGYFIYYIVDDEECIVRIYGIVHSRMNQDRQLTKLDI